MKRNYKYGLSVIPSILTIVGNYCGDNWVWLNFSFSLFFLAFAEIILPEDKGNEHDEDIYFPDSLLFFHVLLQVFCWTTLLGFVISNNNFFLFTGAVLSTGVSTGASGIVIAHELIHRKKRLYNLAGRFLLFLAGNIYFFVDHIKGHHKNVGLYHDSATARRNESVYHFFIRSSWGQLKFSVNSECDKLIKQGKNPYGLGNYVVRATVFQFILIGILFSLLGPVALLAHILQALLANFLLEYINYIEHYGLTRNVGERVNEVHSWQSDRYISRFFLIDLSRHADHHYYASKPYQKLLSYKNSPVLPGGYASTLYLAMIPSLWFRIMNRKLDLLEVQRKGIN